MKKLGIVVGLLVIALSISSASALVWSDYFDTPIFDGGVFVNDTTESDVPEEWEELEKDWLEHEVEMFPPGHFNVTPREEWTDKPSGYFNVTPKAKWTDKPTNWFNVTSEGLSNKPEGYWDVNWGIKI